MNASPEKTPGAGSRRTWITLCLLLALLLPGLAKASADNGVNGREGSGRSNLSNGNDGSNRSNLSNASGSAYGSFLPKIYSTEGEIIADAAYESRRNLNSAGGDVRSSDLFFSERLVLTTTGWVYHPRFLIFLAKIGGGLAHENIENVLVTEGNTGMRSKVLVEYEFRTVLLPEHPYNLELYSLRRDHYTRGIVVYGGSTTSYDTGALFKYKKRPFAFNLSYNFGSRDSLSFTEDTKTLRSNATYFKDWILLTGAYSHLDSHTTFRDTQSRISSDEYGVENQLRYVNHTKKIILTSNLNQTTFNQRGDLNSADDKRFTWNEKLDMELPWNLRAGLYYNLDKETTQWRASDAADGVPLTNTTSNKGFSLEHKLYSSLTTNYNFNMLSLESSTGDLKSNTHALSSVYTKNIPWGVLLAGVNVSRSTIDRGASPTIINEPKYAQLFQEFTLAGVNIDAATISVRVKSAETGDFFDLAVNVDYLVHEVGNTTRIQIINLPSGAMSPEPFFAYEFRATYALGAENASIETSSYGGSFRLELFNHLINPYVIFSDTKQTAVSGFVNGVLEESRTTTAGLLLQKNPFSVLLEYQDAQSNIDPQKIKRAEGHFRSDITRTTNLVAEVFYKNTEHGGAFGQGNRGFTETFVGGNMRVQQRIPAINLSATLGGRASQVTGLSKTQTAVVDGGLIWAVNKLEIRANAGLGRSRVEYATGQQQSDYRTFYVTLRRKIF